MQAMRLRAPFWWIFIILFGFASFQILLNPFGFSDVTQRYTQDISDLLITGPYIYPETGRQNISVALVEDSTLHNLSMPWPWSYGTQARVLDTLLAYKPRTVVVDILFLDPRNDSTLHELTDEIGRYRRANIPLYFVAASDVPENGTPVRRELIDAGAKIVDPTILVNQGIVRQYPITGRCLNGEPAGTICDSLAMKLYRDNFPAQPPADAKGLMELVWGTRTDPFNAKWMRLSDDAGNTYPCEQKISPARRILLAFFDPEAVRSRCPYTSTVPVQSLLMGSDDPDFPAMIENRIVFYGASLEGVQDKSFTPVNGLIASVYVHAMALDNLISFHGQPEQNVVTIAGVTVDNNPAQMAAIIPVILILTWIHFRRLRRRARKPKLENADSGAVVEYIVEKAIELFWHVMAFALALAAGLALTLAVGLSVANWVEVVFVSVELAAMLLIGVPDAIWGYLHHVFAGISAAEQS